MTDSRANALRRVVAALPRAVGASANLIIYGSVLATIATIAVGNSSMIPLLAASPILARLVETVGANLLANVIDRVGQDKQMDSVEMFFRLEQGIREAGDQVSDTISQSTQLLVEIYRLLISMRTLDGITSEQAALLADLTQPLVRALPRTPHLLARIGHDDELRRQTRWLGEIEHDRKGRAAFLMGPVGSGRAAFAGDIRAKALELGYRTAAIRFAPTESEGMQEINDYLRFGRQPPHITAIFDTFPNTAKQAVHRQWTDLMIQLSQAGASSGAAGTADEIGSIGRFVRSAARVGPLVITIENLDWAPSYWIDLLLPIIREIGRDLPVLLLVTVESPAPLNQLQSFLHTEPTRLVQKLEGEGIAETSFFGKVKYDDIARYIHPATGELASRLAYLSGGDPKTIEIIWQEWVGQEAVVRDDAGRWIVTGREDKWWVYGDAADHARQLLDETLDGWDEEPPYSREEIEAILSCAAVEGEIFTLRAVAMAMEMDSDELEEFIDSYLLPYDDPDDPDNNQPGILEDVGFTEVDKFRKLYQYRFARPYLHHVWAKYPSSPERVEEWRRVIPNALEGLYYPYGFRIAGNLARLFAAAGMTDKVEEYRRSGRYEQTLEDLRGYVQTMLSGVPANKYDAYRLFDAGFAFVNKLVTERPDLWQEAYQVARRLAALARCCDDWEYEVVANRLMALAYLNGGMLHRGLFWARRGATLFPRNGVNHILELDFNPEDLRAIEELSSSLRQDQIHLAAFDGTLGYLLQAMGDLAGARPYVERALAISERVLGPEHPDTALSLNNLGGLLQAMGDLAGARPYVERALDIRERVLGPEHPDTAESLNNLGGLLYSMGDLAGARPYYERALAIRERVLGPEHPNTALSLNNLAILCYYEGQFREAADFMRRALAIWEKVLGPEHPNTRGARGSLRAIETKL